MRNGRDVNKSLLISLRCCTRNKIEKLISGSSLMSGHSYLSSEEASLGVTDVSACNNISKEATSIHPSLNILYTTLL